MGQGAAGGKGARGAGTKRRRPALGRRSARDRPRRWTIIIGCVAGIIAKFVMPGDRHEPSGFVLTTILGIVGAFVATWLGQAGFAKAASAPRHASANRTRTVRIRLTRPANSRRYATAQRGNGSSPRRDDNGQWVKGVFACGCGSGRSGIAA